MTEEANQAYPARGNGRGFLLAEEISGASKTLPGYHLYPGDILEADGNGTYTKVAPGLGIMGLELTEDQESRLKPVSYRKDGLIFHLSEEA